jgi:hypothetical protein
MANESLVDEDRRVRAEDRLRRGVSIDWRSIRTYAAEMESRLDLVERIGDCEFPRWRLRSGAPEWMSALVQDMHYDVGVKTGSTTYIYSPDGSVDEALVWCHDDHRYRFIVDALTAVRRLFDDLSASLNGSVIEYECLDLTEADVEEYLPNEHGLEVDTAVSTGVEIKPWSGTAITAVVQQACVGTTKLTTWLASHDSRMQYVDWVLKQCHEDGVEDTPFIQILRDSYRLEQCDVMGWLLSSLEDIATDWLTND